MFHLRTALVALYHAAWAPAGEDADDLSADRKALVVVLTLLALGTCFALTT